MAARAPSAPCVPGMRLKDLIDGSKAADEDDPMQRGPHAVDPGAVGVSFIAQEHEALVQMMRNQERVVDALKAGDRVEARKLRQISKMKELNYKEVCVDKAARGASLRKKETIAPYDPGAWPVLPRLDETLQDKHAAMRAWEPTGHRCYKDLKAFEQGPSQALLDVRRERKAIETEKRRSLAKKKRRVPVHRVKDLQASIFRPADTPVNTDHLRELFDYLDISGDGQLDSTEVASLITEQNAFLGAPCPTEAVGRAFRYCGGPSSRWKNAHRLRTHAAPSNMSFDEFCTVMLAQAAV